MPWVATSLAVGIATLFTLAVARYTIAVIYWLPRRLRWQRAMKGLCPSCGYNLTGNTTGICSECGQIIHSATGQPPRTPFLATERQPWWVWASVGAAMIAAAIVRNTI
ncbi:MAG TPA: hypothetical protein VM008_03345 [Phycisphaerae bacterium]|nr:hypothetical protein [Phycisphaerae bacterium]